MVNVGEYTSPMDAMGLKILPKLPSVKLTVKAPEHGWLEDDGFLLGFCPRIFWGELSLG